MRIIELKYANLEKFCFQSNFHTENISKMRIKSLPVIFCNESTENRILLFTLHTNSLFIQLNKVAYAIEEVVRRSLTEKRHLTEIGIRENQLPRREILSVFVNCV